MMEKEVKSEQDMYWDIFTATGAVKDYLNYSNCRKMLYDKEHQESLNCSTAAYAACTKEKAWG